MKTLILTALAGLALSAGLVYAMSTALALPDVHFSYGTGECVKVVNYADTNYTCDNYPNKFHHVWEQ